MIESEREAWLWVREFLYLYLQEQQYGASAVDGRLHFPTLVDRCRVHKDYTKLQEGKDLVLKDICWRISGICGVLSLMRTDYCGPIIREEMYNRMKERIAAQFDNRFISGYLYPCNMQGKAQRLALCRKFAEECLIQNGGEVCTTRWRLQDPCPSQGETRLLDAE